MMDQKIETITIENISETDEIGQERLSIHQRNTIFYPIRTKNMGQKSWDLYGINIMKWYAYGLKS